MREDFWKEYRAYSIGASSVKSDLCKAKRNLPGAEHTCAQRREDRLFPQSCLKRFEALGPLTLLERVRGRLSSRIGWCGETRVFERLLVRFEEFDERFEFGLRLLFGDRVLFGQIGEQLFRLLLLIRCESDVK